MALNGEGARLRHCAVDDWKEALREQFRATFLEPAHGPDVITSLEPFDAAERMIIQQGLFLASNNITLRFAKVLAKMAHKAGGRLPLFRVQIRADYRTEILAELERMNITEATLFPGIDGFARSLRTRAETPGSVISDWLRVFHDPNRPLPPRS